MPGKTATAPNMQGLYGWVGRAGWPPIRSHRSYRRDPKGGLSLSVSRSDDGGRTWYRISEVASPGRDVDNAMLLQLPDGMLLLACRSVRWQESYRLELYQSADTGKHWQKRSVIDRNEGTPGSLGHPDKGVYEPHLYLLANGRLAVMYANEKHVTDSVSYSQIISEKVSGDRGRTWGPEIRVAYAPGNPAARPGMPVWTRLMNGRYIVVFEVCGTDDCNIHYKISADGIHWSPGTGTPVPGQSGAPFILALRDGRLLVTSNRGHISFSDDNGATWEPAAKPWSPPKTYEEDWTQTIWPSLYQTAPDSVAVVTSVKQPSGAHQVIIRFGGLQKRGAGRAD